MRGDLSLGQLLARPRAPRPSLAHQVTRSGPDGRTVGPSKRMYPLGPSDRPDPIDGRDGNRKPVICIKIQMPGLRLYRTKVAEGLDLFRVCLPGLQGNVSRLSKDSVLNPRFVQGLTFIRGQPAGPTSPFWRSVPSQPAPPASPNFPAASCRAIT